jgi:hypothetical protein
MRESRRRLSFVVALSIGLLIGIGARTAGAQPAPDATTSAAAPDVSVRVTGDARSAAMLPLYATFVALQGFDLQSTASALRRGGTEGNPIMKLSSQMPYLVALKGASTVGVVLTTERIRKRHPVAALLMMAGLNVGYGLIVAHNFSIGGTIH